MSHNRIFNLFRKMFPKYYQFAKDNSDTGEVFWESHESNSIIIQVKRNFKLLFTYEHKASWSLKVYNA